VSLSTAYTMPFQLFSLPIKEWLFYKYYFHIFLTISVSTNFLILIGQINSTLEQKIYQIIKALITTGTVFIALYS
jgi:hypothetical protein